MEATGSHLGVVARIQVYGSVPDRNVKSDIAPLTFDAQEGSPSTSGDEYYAPRYWNEQEYFAWQDTMWNAQHHLGRVDVSPLQNVKDDRASAPGQPTHAPQLE
jgi:hypothetical protein